MHLSTMFGAPKNVLKMQQGFNLLIESDRVFRCVSALKKKMSNAHLTLFFKNVSSVNTHRTAIDFEEHESKAGEQTDAALCAFCHNVLSR